MATLPSGRSRDRPDLSRRRRCRTSLGCTLCDLALRLRNQTQLATGTADEQHRVEIRLALPQSPVQAALTMPTYPDPADHLPQSHALADVQCADHWLIRGANRAMVDADDRLAPDRSDEGHAAVRSRQNCLTSTGAEINPTMT